MTGKIARGRKRVYGTKKRGGKEKKRKEKNKASKRRLYGVSTISAPWVASQLLAIFLTYLLTPSIKRSRSTPRPFFLTSDLTEKFPIWVTLQSSIRVWGVWLISRKGISRVAPRLYLQTSRVKRMKTDEPSLSRTKLATKD